MSDFTGSVQLEEKAQLENNNYVESVFVDDYADLKSDEIKNKLELLRNTQKNMVGSGEALIVSDTDSKKSVVNAQKKQILRCFNSETVSIIKNATAKNVNSSRGKITRAFESINKMFRVDGVEISQKYLETKYDELSLVYAYLLKVEEEAEQRRAIREQLVEEEKAALDSFRKLYADQDWTHQHGFADDTTYFNQLKDRLDKANALRRDSLEENQDTANSIWQSAIADMQSFGDQFAGQLKEKLDTGKISMDEAKNKAKEFADQLNAMGIPTVGSNLQKLADGTTSAQKAMDDLNKSAVQCLGNLKTGLIDAIVEGGNFADTLSNVGKQLMKIALNSMITPWFNGIFKGLIGAHTGGVIGIDPPSFVRSLPKFHTGGVVGANEQLAVLQTGEAVFTKEQQKALGGLIHKDTSVKDITINITNNGSGNMSNEQAQQLAKQIKAYVKTEVADEMYTYNRQKMYSMG